MFDQLRQRLPDIGEPYHAIGKATVLYVATVIAFIYAMYARLWMVPAGTWTPSDVGGVPLWAIFAALSGALFFVPLATVVLYRFREHRIAMRGLSVGIAISTLPLAGILGYGFVVYSLEVFVRGVDGVAKLAMFYVKTVISIGPAALAATLIDATWRGEFRPRVQRTHLAVVVGALLLATAPVAAAAVVSSPSGADDTDGTEQPARPDYGDGYEGYANESAYLAAFDDGHDLPIVIGNEDITAQPLQHGAEPAACWEMSNTPPTPNRSTFHGSLVPEYDVSKTHVGEDQIRLGYFYFDGENRSGRVPGRYRWQPIVDGVNASDDAVIDAGVYRINRTQEPHHAGVFAGNPRLDAPPIIEMEQVESMWMYYDVVDDQGRIHRYAVKLCREPAGETDV